MKIALIGCGHWGKNLARNFAQQNVLGAIVDPSKEGATINFADQDIPLRTLEDVLADDSIEAIAVSTPAETHKDISLAAIAAGKHVYVEKPLALTVADGEKIVEAANEKGVILMVGHLLQYHPVFAHLRDSVLAGDYGKIRYAYSHRLSMGIFRTQEDAFWSLAPHDISMLIALFGEEPTEVRGSGLDFITEGIADEARLDMVFSDGRRAHIFVSWLHPFKEQKLVIVAEEAMLVFDDTKPWAEKLAVYKHLVEMAERGPVPVKADVEYIDVPQGEPLGSECAHFIECCKTGKKPYTDGEEALRVLRVLELPNTLPQA